MSTIRGPTASVALAPSASRLAAMTLPLPLRTPSYRWDAVRFAHKSSPWAMPRGEPTPTSDLDRPRHPFFADVSLAELGGARAAASAVVLPAPAELHRDRLRRLQPAPSGDAAAARRVRGDVHRRPAVPRARVPDCWLFDVVASAPRRAARTSTTSPRASAGAARTCSSTRASARSWIT